jgi:hypothetical protein
LLFAWHDPVLDRLYLQVDDATPNFATWAGGTINNGVGAMNIGRFPFSNGLRWDGMLDEVSFWKRVLTPEERAWLYNAGAGRSWPWSYVPAPISGAATFAGVSGMSALPPVRLRGGTASFSAHSDMAEVGTIATTRNYVWPPGKPKGNWFILDCRLGDSRVLFDRRSLTHFGNAREVIIEMREAGGLTEAELSESGYIRLRSLSLGAYVETFEKEL